MPRFNRVLGFLSVSFVLLFIAKINKMELYTAYFRTLADVEIRNSQALRHEGQYVYAVADLPVAASVAPTSSMGDGGAGFLASKAEWGLVAVEALLPIGAALCAAPVVMPVFVPQTAPRAPDRVA